MGEQFKTLVNSGNVEDLSSVFEEDTAFRDTFVPGSLDAVSYDGKVYGADLHYLYGSLVQQGHLRGERVEVPKTYEDLRA